MRGRLIFPFLAEIKQLDTTATDAAPGPGPDPPSGYDTDFRETVKVAQPGEQVGADARKEKDAIRVKCQVAPESHDALQQFQSGAVPSSEINLTFHYRDLERAGLVDSATGEALLRANDRLVAIRDLRGELVQAIRTPPGLYALEIRPVSYGLGRKRNLLMVRFEDREQGTRATA